MRHPNGKLSLNELRHRASKIKILLTYNDGVLTDAGVYYSHAGEELKRFSIRDGMGVERLRHRGIETAIITGETSECVKRRAEKLQLKYVYLGIRDKKAHLETILYQTGCSIEELAYIGDDVLDLEIMREIGSNGLTAAPFDAMPEIRRLVHYSCELPGGHGAFREFAEWIIHLRTLTAVQKAIAI
jgi:3-deoxy-D-manno-octulosonate 8-phosphate phosphatase (KDO 8-P phosphatase)